MRIITRTQCRRSDGHGSGGLIRSVVRPTVAGIALLALVVAAPPAGAEEPLRLRLVRWAADAGAPGAECIRGRLYAVLDFDDEATDRGVWLADTLEVPTGLDPADDLPTGVHAGVADGSPSQGFRIRIADVERVLAAHPEGPVDHAHEIILLGRRPVSAGTGPCNLDRERLADGAALLRRIRDIYDARADGRPIEILMER